MEAHSLTALNTLAANPPQYPEKPSEEREEPLTLYISRVPGTRDVILSTSKPQLKNVTGEDVGSSFYYVHLEMPDHASTIPFSQRGHQSRDDSPASRTIPRKPLPGTTAAVASESSTSLGAQIQAALGENESHIPTRPSQSDASSHWSRRQSEQRLSSYADGFNQLPATDMPPPPPPHKELPTASASLPPAHLPKDGITAIPLPPPPNQFFAPPTRKPVGPMAAVELPEPKPKPSILETRHWRSSSGDALINESVETSDYASHNRQRARSGSRSPAKRSRSGSVQGNPFTLTLIRRDPSTGNQWNVGKISSHQMEPLAEDGEQTPGFLATSPPPPAPLPSTIARPPIDIQLETSGYAKFRGMPSKKSLDAAAVAATAAEFANINFTPADDSAGGRGEFGIFSRQVVMSYSKSWTSNLRDTLQRIEQSGWPVKGHTRNGSDASADSTGSSSAGEHQGSSVGGPGKGMKPRGYTFTSPWDGKCDFRTGNGGRSVRCYHTLHEGQNATFNPLTGEHGPGLSKPAGETVSELRFNLPGPDLLPGQSSKDTKAQIRGHFNKVLRVARGEHGHEDDEDDDTISPFETNVGSEKAGGGNRGSRAKLGKLIIFSDGLKMLDLIVAANIGVWWGAWERSF